MMRLLSFVVVALVSSVSLGHATLIDRGGGLIYDTDLNITWLQDANYAKTSGHDIDGEMHRDTARNWVASLVYGGFADWRLPTALNRDGTGPCGGSGIEGSSCNDSELGHLYHVELGNPLYGPLVNRGPFVNIVTNTLYWTATDYIQNPGMTWVYYFNLGWQTVSNNVDYSYIAWAVRDGDVVPVPEPATFLLLGAGLFTLWPLRKVMARR